MKLLLFTQKVDREDPVLGFFHGWIEKLSKKFDSVEVICLSKGNFSLPNNVTVYSLGKPQYQSKVMYGAGRIFLKIKYLINLYKYLHLIRGSYDCVFVHMNQEYVLLGGIYWKFKNIPVYMWRNHAKGSIFTRLSVLLSTKVFCTSPESFTAKFNKTKIMPVGVDTDIFKPIPSAVRKKYSIVMVGRVSPVKRIELGLESIKFLISRGVQATFTIVGPVLEKDKAYLENLKRYVEKNNISSVVQFLDGVNFEKLPEIYNSYEICLNLTGSGSFDKTVVESSACGAIPLVTNISLKEFLPESCLTSERVDDVASSIERLLNPAEQVKIYDDLRKFVESQNLKTLVDKIFQEIK